MSKRKHNKEIVILTTLFIASVLTFAAGSLGTYAWYSYNARASAMYNGAAIGDGGSLQVGIFSDVEIPRLESFSNIRKDTTEKIAKYVYWSSGGFSQEQVSAYAITLGYTTNFIGPTTSGRFECGKDRDISIKSAPAFIENRKNQAAKYSNYLYLPLVFKFGSYSNYYIDLSGISFKTESEISESVRIGIVDSFYGDAFILNPSAPTNGTTQVCGNLDLNADGYYDYNGLREYIYGYYGNFNSKTPYTTDIIPDGELTTFNAKHMKGLTGFEFEPYYADYLCCNEVLNCRHIAKSDGQGITHLHIYIYLEGWDPTCLETGIGTRFKLDFEFNATEGE